MERFKSIEGLSNYLISDSGKIITLHDRSGRRREMKGVINKQGYNQFMLVQDNGERLQITGHELVMLAFYGQRPNGHEIHHKNFDKKDNRLDNLEYLTFSEHKYLHKSWSLEEVEEIRYIYMNHAHDLHELAHYYGLTESGVRMYVKDLIDEYGDKEKKIYKRRKL